MALTYEQKWHRLKRALEIANEASKVNPNQVEYDKSTILQVLFIMSALEDGADVSNSYKN